MTEPLPELHQGELDEGTLRALFDDLERHTEVLDVLVKGAGYANEAPVPLREAQAALTSGAVRGVQVRYRWDGAEWRDTLMRTAGGVRVVRMRMG